MADRSMTKRRVNKWVEGWTTVTYRVSVMYREIQAQIEKEVSFYRKNYKRLTSQKRQTHYNGIMKLYNTRNGVVWLLIRQAVVQNLVYQASKIDDSYGYGYKEIWMKFKKENPEFDKLFNVQEMYLTTWPPYTVAVGAEDPFMIAVDFLVSAATAVAQAIVDAPERSPDIDMSTLPQPPPEVVVTLDVIERPPVTLDDLANDRQLIELQTRYQSLLRTLGDLPAQYSKVLSGLMRVGDGMFNLITDSEYINIDDEADKLKNRYTALMEELATALNKGNEEVIDSIAEELEKILTMGVDIDEETFQEGLVAIRKAIAMYQTGQINSDAFNELKQRFKITMGQDIKEIIRKKLKEKNVEVEKLQPSATDLRKILEQLLTIDSSIINVPRDFLALILKDNPELWSQIWAVFSSVLDTDALIEALKIPTLRTGAGGNQQAYNKAISDIVNRLKSATGSKLSILRSLNDLVLYYLSNLDTNTKLPWNVRTRIANDLGIPFDKVDPDALKQWIKTRIIQPESEDLPVEDPTSEQGMFDYDIFENLQNRVYRQFMSLGILSEAVAQNFALNIISSMNKTSEFRQLDNLDKETKSYKDLRLEAMKRVLDTVQGIIDGLKAKLQGVHIDIDQVISLMYEAVATYRRSRAKGLKGILDSLVKQFKKVEVKMLKPPSDGSGGAGTPPSDPSEPSDPSQAQPDPSEAKRIVEENKEKLEVIEEEVKEMGPEEISDYMNEIIDQSAGRGWGYLFRKRQWKDGDPADLGTPLEMVNTNNGKRYLTTVGKLVALFILLTGLGLGIWELIEVISDGLEKPDQPPVPPKPVPPTPPGPTPPGPTPPIPVDPIPEDDDHSWIKKPYDEGDILISAVNPAETYLLNSTDEEKKKEEERWRQFSLVPPDDLTNPLVFSNYMAQNRRFKNTYPNPKVPDVKYIDIPRNRQPQFQDVRFDVFNRKTNQFQEEIIRPCRFTREIPEDPFKQDYAYSNYFPDRAFLRTPIQPPVGGNSLMWVNNDGADRFSKKDRWYEGSYVGQRDVDKDLYKSKKYNFSVDRFYSRKQN